MLNELLYERCFPTVSPEIPRVEQTSAATVDEERIRVEAAVIHQIRRDGERPESEWTPILESNPPAAT